MQERSGLFRNTHVIVLAACDRTTLQCPDKTARPASKPSYCNSLLEGIRFLERRPNTLGGSTQLARSLPDSAKGIQLRCVQLAHWTGQCILALASAIVPCRACLSGSSSPHRRVGSTLDSAVVNPRLVYVSNLMGFVHAGSSEAGCPRMAGGVQLYHPFTHKPPPSSSRASHFTAEN